MRDDITITLSGQTVATVNVCDVDTPSGWMSIKCSDVVMIHYRNFTTDLILY